MIKPGRAQTFNEYEGLLAVVREEVAAGDILALTGFVGKRHHAALATIESGRLLVAAHGGKPGGKVLLVPWMILEGSLEGAVAGDKLFLGAPGKLALKGKRCVGRVLDGPAMLLDPNA